MVNFVHQLEMRNTRNLVFLIFFVVTVLEVVLAQEIFQDETIPGDPVYPLSLEPRTNETLGCDSATWGLTCSGCFQLQVCLGNKPVSVKDCKDLNQNTPYCDEGHCTNDVPKGCENELPPSAFVCTGSGLYPNTKDCTKYFVCGDAGEPPREYVCPSPLIYNSKQNGCTRRVSYLDCQVIDCTKNSDKFILYNPDKSILAYCHNGAEYPVLTRCLDYANQEYDLNTLQCKFVCRSEGRYPDSNDCKKYYQCVRNGISYLQVHGNCSPLWFDSESGTCVRQKPPGCS